MISAVFVVKRHEEYGENGLVMEGRRWTDPLGGMAVTLTEIRDEEEY